MMRSPKLNIRALILGFLFLVLSLPGLNLMLPFIESGNLLGDVHLAPDTTFTPESWIAGRYQQQKDKYINDNIGFRPDFVRLNNELDYLLFQKLHAAGVVLGQDGYLYESGYINAYNGTDFFGRDSILKQLTKLRFIQDTLARAGKALVLAFTPSKGRYYPEHFPKSMQHPPTAATNYAVMLETSERLGINHIDLNGWFRSMKATTPHPLFSKQGIHWTHWGADLAGDTFNHYLEKLLRIDMPDMHIDGVECTDEPRLRDDDIAQGLNLIWPVARETFCYNHMHFDEDPATKTKPAAIFISDSFFWTFIAEGIAGRCYTGWESWFYFNDIWDEASVGGHGDVRYINSTDWMETITHKDAVVIFFTEPNLGWAMHFIDVAYPRFGGK